MKAIVLAAGKGKRLASEQHTLPKVMRLINGRPLLQYVLDAISFIPQKDTAVVVGYKKEKVMEGISGDYLFAVQDKQLGTGHAAGCAKEVLDDLSGNVLICYGDMPLFSRETYEGIVAAHEKSGADCTLLTAIAPNSGLHYGRVIRDNGRFVDIVEHSDCTPEQRKINELNVGIYVFKTALLFEMLQQLTNANSKGEYYLTDVPKLLMSKGRKVETFTIHNSNEIYGVNTPEELAFCEEIIMQLEKAKEKKNGRWFGTGGWRAIIGDEFTKANVQIVAQAISDDMKAGGWGEIVIGFDRRFLSDKAAAWAAEVFAANHITVYFISRIAPTPLVMFTVKNSGAKYGICITASHNPAEYNGIKVFTEGGRDASLEVTSHLEEIISRGVTVSALPFDEGLRSGRIRAIDPSNDYIDSIISMINMEAIRNRGLRVLIDPMFGVSKATLQTILMTARCDVDIINARHDALFGGRLPAPTQTTLAKLRDMVVEQNYDLGLGTDGDADRIGVIDHVGNFIHPNQILTLLYYYLLEYKGWRGDCVRNISTTHILDKIAESYGQCCHEVPVGFKYISSKMEETDAVIGGESSGGLAVRGHIMGKDGIFASALMVEMVSVSNKSIPQLLEEISQRYGSTYMTEFESKFSPEKKKQLEKLLFEEKKLPDFGQSIAKISYADGCKVYFEDGGWIIARFSGTEPLLRIMCEMSTQQQAQLHTDTMREFLAL